MTHFLRLFLLLVVIPLGLVASAGSILVARSSEAALLHAQIRMGQAAASIFRLDMAETSERLVESAQPLPNPEMGSPAVQAALRGDTVAALGSTGAQLQLTVILADEISPPRAGHPLGGARIRAGTTPFQPPFLQTLEEYAGYRSAVYLRGRRTATSRSGFGPESVSTDQLSRLAGEPGGTRIRWLDESGVLVPVAEAPGAPATVAILVAPSGRSQQRWESLSLVTTQVATLIVAVLVGWLLLGRAPCEQEPPPPPVRGGLVVSGFLALLLLGWVWSLLARMEGAHQRDLAETTSRDLVRVLSVARQDPARFTVSQAEEVWGFHATRIRGGVVEASSIDPEAGAEGLLTLPTPPPSFPISGQVSLGGEEHLYAGAILEEGGVLFLTHPKSPEDRATVRYFLLALGLAGALPVLLFMERIRRALRPQRP